MTTQTKQQRYKQKMAALGYSKIEVQAHIDDRELVRHFARMLREKRSKK